jgi:16S rRNA (adenine(1408)-N(1))-methyltransferase
VIVDAGTGDGRALLHEARRNPDTLYVGVDIDVRAMAGSARRAAAKPARGGCPNVLFAVSAVEGWPAEAGGLAHLVLVRYPWGSLLRGVLGREPAVLAALGRTIACGGSVVAMVSLVDRDGVEPPAPEELRAAYAAAAMDLAVVRPATEEEIATASTTWARRLGVGARRSATRIEAVRRC